MTPLKGQLPLLTPAEAPAVDRCREYINERVMERVYGKLQEVRVVQRRCECRRGHPSDGADITRFHRSGSHVWHDKDNRSTRTIIKE